MKKRWFVVILTIGLLLHVLPLSVLALSPDPTITDSDGTILDWSDLSTVPYSLDDSQEQNSAVVDADNDEEAADGTSCAASTLAHWHAWRYMAIFLSLYPGKKSFSAFIKRSY